MEELFQEFQAAGLQASKTKQRQRLIEEISGQLQGPCWLEGELSYPAVREQLSGEEAHPRH